MVTFQQRRASEPTISIRNAGPRVGTYDVGLGQGGGSTRAPSNRLTWTIPVFSGQTHYQVKISKGGGDAVNFFAYSATTTTRGS